MHRPIWLLGALPPDPHHGSVPGLHWDFQPPDSVPTLPPNPGYATAGQNCASSTILNPWPPSPPQFDVSFPEKLLKIVATRGEIVSLKFTKYRLTAGLRPDPLWELKRSPDLLAAIRGPASKGRERKEGVEREGSYLYAIR